MSRRIAQLATAIAVTGCLVGGSGLLAGCASKSGSGGTSGSGTSGSSTSGSSASGSSGSGVGGSNPVSGTSKVSFQGVIVNDATSLSRKPNVTSSSTSQPSTLQVKDLVLGTGQAATPTSSVTVQYVGVRYADGKQFDASWDHGGATSFPLTQVVPGFTQGIGGGQGIEAMKVGGRRLMILPAALGYGSTGTQDGSIPPNAAIVFVVDLVGVD